jgi:formylglycine-generating enzyme required for sulfatase activity
MSDRFCAPLGEGPQPKRSGRKDRLPLAGGATVNDLAGGMAEWVVDDFIPMAACRTAPVLVDPRCSDPAKRATFRGGSWSLPSGFMSSDNRGTLDSPNNGIGFRCVRPSE